MTRPTATPPHSATVPPSSPPLAEIALPPIPAEVQKFAEEVGAAPYLSGVLAFGRRIYPQGELSIILLEDAEIADYLHIACEFDVTGWTADQIRVLMTQWSCEIGQHCPTTHTPYFTYLLRERR